MATKTVKLVYEATGKAVKAGDPAMTHEGPGIISNIHAPRKKPGMGRITLKHPDGSTHDYSPGVIKAVWR